MRRVRLAVALALLWPACSSQPPLPSPVPRRLVSSGVDPAELEIRRQFLAAQDLDRVEAILAQLAAR